MAKFSMFAKMHCIWLLVALFFAGDCIAQNLVRSAKQASTDVEKPKENNDFLQDMMRQIALIENIANVELVIPPQGKSGEASSNQSASGFFGTCTTNKRDNFIEIENILKSAHLQIQAHGPYAKYSRKIVKFTTKEGDVFSFGFESELEAGRLVRGNIDHNGVESDFVSGDRAVFQEMGNWQRKLEKSGRCSSFSPGTPWK